MDSLPGRVNGTLIPLIVLDLQELQTRIIAAIKNRQSSDRLNARRVTDTFLRDRCFH